MAQRKVAIIAGNGDLATAYKVLNIATTAAAMGADVRVFFTFGGLKILDREANRHLPEPPGQEGMRAALAAAGVPGVPELLEMAKEAGVQLVACQMTLDVLKLDRSRLVDGIADFAGAATFLEFALGADVALAF
jgi:peroxiredoxin family protein